ncbi:alpha-protein kinase 3 [Cetorhinus maximus]
MGSKRVIRSYSANGRYSFDTNEEVEPPSRGDASRNYFLNVRPENRQTFCNIIAQITEETQPGFETTLKSYAISENTDVKFTCIVTGHPAPEITWYKDDKEMDRYCGLPKYQIFRYGKKHSLHLYKCTEDDAAVYQASARNNKGIVSCSGTLEVGTMNEYKIHQRWFARLKQKAETKRRELEETWIRGKENMAHTANAQHQNLLRTVSPERVQRKRKSQSEANANLPDSLTDKDDVVKVRIPDPEAVSHKNMAGMPSTDTMSKPTASASEVQNGYLMGSQGAQPVAVKDGKPPVNNSPEDLVENGISLIDYLYQTTELVRSQPTGKEFAASKKKRKLSKEESELSVRKAEESSQGDESVLNGIDRNKYTGTLSQCLPDTLRGNMKGGDPQPVKSGDYMKIDEQASSMMLGRRQHSAVPSSPKGVFPGKEKDLMSLDCQSPKDTEPEVTKFTNDAKSSVDQEPVHSNLQTPIKDTYFSMKDMFFETVQEPEKHRQLHLPQTMETNDQANSQDHANQQEASSAESINVTYLMDVIPRCEPKQGKASEDLQNMGTNMPEMDIAMPCVHSEIQNKGTFDNNITSNIQQSSEVRGSSIESLECGVSSTDVSDKAVQEDFSPPLCALDVMPQPALQPLIVLADIQPEDEPKASPPPVQVDLAEGLKPALPTQQLAQEVLSETAGSKEQAESDFSPVSESTGDVCSVNSFNGEWEKLDFLNTPEQSDISDEPRTPETTTSEGTELELRDSPSEGMLLPPKDKETLPDTGRSSQATQPIYQQDLGLKIDVEAMEVTSTTSDDQAPVEDKPQTAGEGPVPVGSVVPEVKEARTTAGPDTLTEGPSIPLALFVEENFAEATSTDKKLPEEMIAEIEGEFMKVDRAEEAGAEEDAQRDMSTDSFGAHLVEKLLSYLKIPSFLLGEKPPTVGVGKPEAMLNISALPEAHSHTEDISKNKSLPKESLLEKEVVQTLPTTLLASTEDLRVNEEPASAGPLAGTDVDHVMPLPSTMEEPNVDTFTSAPLLMKASLDPALPADTPPSTPEHNHATGMSDTQPSLHPTAGHLENLDVSHSELNLMVAPKDQNVADTPTLLPTLDVKKLEDVREGQGMTAFSSTEDESDKYIAPCLAGTAEESSVVKEVTGEGSKLLEVVCIPSNETESAPKPIILRIEDTMSDNDLQQTKNISDAQALKTNQVPSIVVGNEMFKNTGTAKVEDSEAVKKDIPAVPLLQALSTKIKLSDAPPIIPSATPAELASGARRKIFLPRSKQLDDSEGPTSDVLHLPTQPKKEEAMKRIHQTQGDVGLTEEESSQFLLAPRRSGALLQAPVVQQTVPMEKRSPTLARKMDTLEVPKLHEEPEDQSGSSPKTKGEMTKDAKPASIKSEGKTEGGKSTKNPFKAPQVIRKIRMEQFSDASGNLKLWCQFFNVLSDSTIRWQKDGLHLDKLKRSVGDESQVSLAIVQASAKDCGVYKCVVENEYGSDTTDFLVSSEALSRFISREDIEVGEEIEMTPMLITKGLTDEGFWGNKLFGRIMTKELHFGDGFRRKASQAKVIYGLEPIFESGATCIVKVRNYISYGTKSKNGLIERNHDITMQECKLQNTAREYSKIFAAEARVIEAFGPVPEVIPLHLLYRPANNIPYATIEKDLNGQFTKYSMEDKSKNLSESEIGQKCHTFQHWIYQWTNGNLLITDLQGVGLKLTDVQIATTSKGYQGLTGNCASSVIEEFATAHQCNRYCEALGLKSIDSLQLAKPKTSKSPLMTRKAHSAQSSPQIQRKGLSSPQASRKSATSPNIARKAGNTEDSSRQTIKHKTVEVPKPVKLR